MTLDTSSTADSRDEPEAPAEPAVPMSDADRSPFTLGSLLDLNDEELAQPPAHHAPREHRWEQLSLGVTPETGEAIPSPMVTGDADEPPYAEQQLIPGLETPGAVHVPVYLAGRTLHDLVHGPSAHTIEHSNHPATLADADADDDLDVSVWTVADVSTEELAELTLARDAALRIAESDDRTGGSEDLSASAPDRLPSPGPAIAVAALGRRQSATAPSADFATTGDRPLLWPRPKARATPSVLPQECAKCGAASRGDTCAACGHHTTVTARNAITGAWHHFVAAFLDSDSRLLRTVGALILAPGELTSAFVAGTRRRYFGPMPVAGAALLLFAVASAIGGLRPRPDRALIIGAERTVEFTAGLADRAQINLAVDAAPDLIHDIASALDYVPVLWLPLMAFGVVAVVAVARTSRRRDDHVELAFAAHFAAWFTLWWGIAVPLLLLLSKIGFEYSAAWEGLNRVRYGEDGQIDGLSSTWNAMRAMVIAPGFHTALLALGLGPWTVGAYRRAFDSRWMRAAIAGVLITAIPLLLLAPFA
jgi:hypothetical protein